MSSHLADVDLGVDIAVSDAMLMPLIEVAADVLKELEPAEVPPSLRPLHGFDRRGMLAGPAPRQLRRAFVSDSAFRQRVIERFLARSEVELVLAAWTTEHAAAIAAAAVECGDLALYASTLWAARPDGYAFGLGVAVVLEAQLRNRQREADAGRSAAHERAALEEAYRRAEAARIESDTALARAEQELLKERSSRRLREDEAIGAAGAAQAQVDALQTQLDQARAEVAEQQSRVARASQRAHTLEDDLRRVRADSRVLQARADSAESRLGARDERALADAVATVRQLSVSLDALQRRVRDDAYGEGPHAAAVLQSHVREPAPTRRTHPRLPPGVVANSPAGVEAMLATPDVVLIVDGYNVGHRAWPESTAGDQRERLGIAATALCRRLGCEVVLVFDGNGCGSRPSLRRGGVRVLFSEAGEEADEVVVREVESRPRRIPVVVASSDAWVAEHARDQGAAVVGADALVARDSPDSLIGRVSSESRARIRAVWALLAGVDRFPANGSLVTVSTASRICPPGWAGVVALGAGVVATVPHASLVASFTRALDRDDWDLLALEVQAQEARGPAQLAYADRDSFVPHAVGVPIDTAHTGSVRVGRFIASVPETDATEAGVAACTSPMFCVVDGDRVVAAAGYRVWCEELAHMSVLVAPDRRGLGLARSVATAATEHALANGLLAQWRAVPPESQAVAAALGYDAMGRQISLRVA